MKTIFSRSRSLATPLFTALLTALPAALISLSAPGQALDAGCNASARFATLACEYAVREAYHTQRAQCLNSTGVNEEPGECDGQANGLLIAGRDDCATARALRANICAAAEDAAYEPDYGTRFVGNFVNPLQIGAAVATNPLFPLTQGNSWTYAASYVIEQVQVTQTRTTTVTNKTKRIDGVTCLVVNEVVERDGEIIEDSDRWLAQDTEGNVWQCGSELKFFENSIEDLPIEPELVANTGSFKAGRDMARAGIVMPATPADGMLIRQQWAANQAETAAEIVAINADEASPAATCSGSCVEVILFSPLTPAAEIKIFYATDIGRIVEIDANNIRFELTSFVSN